MKRSRVLSFFDSLIRIVFMVIMYQTLRIMTGSFFVAFFGTWVLKTMFSGIVASLRAQVWS